MSLKEKIKDVYDLFKFNILSTLIIMLIMFAAVIFVYMLIGFFISDKLQYELCVPVPSLGKIIKAGYKYQCLMPANSKIFSSNSDKPCLVNIDENNNHIVYCYEENCADCKIIKVD